jgi:hypothetical protein
MATRSGGRHPRKSRRMTRSEPVETVFLRHPENPLERLGRVLVMQVGRIRGYYIIEVIPTARVVSQFCR